jgi:hypothetical protein
MTGTQLRTLLDTLLPEDILLAAMEKFGFQERHRKLQGVTFLRAMILAASGPNSGRQADVMRLYFRMGAPRVARASFYDRFGPALENVMAELSRRALEYVTAQPCDLPGFLGCVRDWRIADSTTCKLDAALAEVYPGTGDYAAVKVHKVLSVGCGTTVAYHFSPAREHDSKHLAIDETWRGLGLLADLGYASLARLRDCQRHGVAYVLRLKDNWQPKVHRISRGEVTSAFTAGTDLDVLLVDDVLLLNGKVIDAEVSFGAGPDRLAARLVGVPMPNGHYGFYLTNLPASIGPLQIGDLYRVRWEIESNNKLDKSCYRLDEIDARKPEAVRALLHASLIASIIVCLLAHQHQLSESRPRRAGAERTSAPLHPQTLARMLAVMALELAALLAAEGKSAITGWREAAALLTSEGRDPNWRRRPSILDQLRGWSISPGQPKKARRASRAAGVANRS